MDILIVCTGNICRSPMAAGLLQQRLDERGIEANVSSTGRTFDDEPASEAAVAVLRDRGIDIDGHRSRMLDAAQLGEADLVLCMAREHVRDAVLLDPPAFPRVFALKELLRRGEVIGPRLPSESVAQWVKRAGLGRRPQDLLGANPSDDVADPYGQSWEVYDETADELDRYLTRLVELVWPAATPTSAATPLGDLAGKERP